MRQCANTHQLHSPSGIESNPIQRWALHNESHHKERTGWLRAAVLGANDGLISTSSLVVGVAAAGPSHSAIMLTAIAGLAAGTLSMASGEYVSVSSQADTEKADLTQERGELAASPKAEHAELAGLYVARGLTGSPTTSGGSVRSLLRDGGGNTGCPCRTLASGDIDIGGGRFDLGPPPHAWRNRGSYWGCPDHSGRSAGSVLGCGGHGVYGCNRTTLRFSRLKGSLWSHLASSEGCQ